MKTLLTLALFIMISSYTQAQQIIPLYPEGIKNHQESDEQEKLNPTDILWIEQPQVPTLEIYLPSKANANGKAVVICPGGGYVGLAYDWEGTDIAKWFNAQGIAAFVLKYRLPNSRSVETGRLAPLQDAQRALRIVRQHATDWNIESDQIGVMGFSAGGHLASTLGTKYDYEDDRYFDDTSIDTVSARPDFMILIYPVISMDKEITHMGSRNSLIGENPSQEMIDLYSNEKQITEHTPPTILIHSGDDETVPVDNSIRFYQSLQKAGIHSEMHLYPDGGHGYSLAVNRGNVYLKTWPDRVIEWLNALNEK